ncbi:hypothetical protein BAUCODRAFT_339570 [Baudoinia panamericana UAMH 10762]|uniref:Fork-head domain-containing protein n=1 Tax=Baudoinia panamericana (strain UAMH 10762) TaxID=717646 RepID=M2LXW6_BAUPA|nr:uncharacterized protein BAUCODRAFT_339570 [Baudoinia panamericana UAMH 10762]EMC99522.1 hypothetical protein BAUCODRAFT_339570 [Baudoinia panamericana UAMH 10762]
MDIGIGAWATNDLHVTSFRPDQGNAERSEQQYRQSYSPASFSWRPAVDEVSNGEQSYSSLQRSTLAHQAAANPHSPPLGFGVTMAPEVQVQVPFDATAPTWLNGCPSQSLQLSAWPDESAMMPCHEPQTALNSTFYAPQVLLGRQDAIYNPTSAPFEDYSNMVHFSPASCDPTLSPEPDSQGEEQITSEAAPMWTQHTNSDDLDNVEQAELCYAKLLYWCLMEAPDYTMTLKDLYAWVKEHSQKARDPDNKGWQNSVRHNLSMNAAFEKAPPNPLHSSKKGSLWRLTSHAVENGVISTTRYRLPSKLKSIRRGAPAIKRQISGAKGGQATRNTLRHQRALREARSFPSMHRQHQRQQCERPPSRLCGAEMWAPPRFQQALPHVQPGITAAPLFAPPPPPPSSPYFTIYDDYPMSQSAPQTPPTQMPMLYPDHTLHKPSALPDFTFGHIGGGIIGDHDGFIAEMLTPSPTELSVLSEDGVQSFLSGNASRETTSFPEEIC